MPMRGGGYGSFLTITTGPTRQQTQETLNRPTAANRDKSQLVAGSLREAPADAYGQVVHADGPVAWYRGNGNTDDYIADNPGTAFGGVTYGSALLPALPAAQSFNFDGTDDYVEVPDQPQLDITSEISVECWFVADSYGGNNYDSIVSKHLSWSLELFTGQPEFYVDTSGGASQARSATAVTPGQLYHMVGTFDGSTIRLYLNGSEAATPASLSGTVDVNNEAVIIGGWSGADALVFDGRVAEVAVYNRVLTSTEVAEHYSTGSPITGSGALDATAATLSGTGTLAATGAGALAATAATLSGAGTATVTGTGAAAATAASLSGAGTLHLSGTGALTATAATLNGTGSLTATGTGAATATAATLAGSGTLNLTGTGAPAAAAVTLAGAGSLTATGTGALDATPATLAGSGTITAATVTGGGDLTATAAALAGSGTLTATGAGDLTATAATLNAAGTLAATGTGALDAPPATLAGSGTLALTGTGDLTATPAVLDGAGLVTEPGIVGGAGDLEATPATLSGTGTLAVAGAGALAAQAAELATAAVVSLTGAGSLTGTAATLAGAGTVTGGSGLRDITLSVGAGRSRTFTAAPTTRGPIAVPHTARAFTAAAVPARSLVAAGASRTLTATPTE